MKKSGLVLTLDLAALTQALFVALFLFPEFLKCIIIVCGNPENLDYSYRCLL